VRRRAFVAHAAAAAAAATWPRWLRRAFAADADCPPGTEKAPSAPRWLEIVSAAYRRAQAAGKPLLVLVVPRAIEERWIRGVFFGELLNHGADDAMAALALAEVTTAPMSAVRGFVPSAGPGEPLMLLVETDAVPARARALDARPPLQEKRVSARADNYAEMLAAEERLVDARIALLGKLVRDGLAPDGATVARRARQQEARLAPSQLLAVNGAITAPSPDAAALDAGAAIAYLAARRAPSAARAQLLAALAKGARARVAERRVPGSRWAETFGCGSHIEWEEGEEHEEIGIGCGMGHVPEKSGRFLDFLTADGSWEKGGRW
jgi:hypothetical protein